MLLTSYIIQGCEREKNHWAVFEAWIVMASYVLAVASKHRTSSKWWANSLELCEIGAVRSLEALYEECAQNKTNFTQGDPFTDGSFYALRITILAGVLSALSLYHRVKSEKWKGEEFVYDFLLAHETQLRVWGESATPYLMMAALELERHGAHTRGERLITQVLKTIVDLNGSRGRGLPNPYYGPEHAFRLQSGLHSTNREVFAGVSYTLEPLIEFLARRLLRRRLAYFWEAITRVQFIGFRPTETWEWFQWKAENGSLDQRMPDMPQSWATLRDRAENAPAGLPKLLADRPALGILFGLVFPHRFGVGLFRLIDRAIRRSL